MSLFSVFQGEARFVILSFCARHSPIDMLNSPFSIDQADVRQRIAEVTAPVLLDRCEVVLRNYMADQPLLGRCPFPRYLMG